MACNLITFYDKKTEHGELKRRQKEIYHKRLPVLIVFKFNSGIVTNTSGYNLVEGLDLKKPIQIRFS